MDRLSRARPPSPPPDPSRPGEAGEAEVRRDGPGAHRAARPGAGRQAAERRGKAGEVADTPLPAQRSSLRPLKPHFFPPQAGRNREHLPRRARMLRARAPPRLRPAAAPRREATDHTLPSRARVLSRGMGRCTGRARRDVVAARSPERPFDGNDSRHCSRDRPGQGTHTPAFFYNWPVAQQAVARATLAHRPHRPAGQPVAAPPLLQRAVGRPPAAVSGSACCGRRHDLRRAHEGR